MTERSGLRKQRISDFWLMGFVLAALVFAIWIDYRSEARIAALEEQVAVLVQAGGDGALRSADIDSRIQAYFDGAKQKKRDALFAKYTAAEQSIPGDRRIYGSPRARFTLVEFSDLECPFCKKYHSTPKTVVDASNGIINWEWIHLPLAMHNPTAFMEHQAAECAASLGGNPAFWVFVDQVFSRSRGGGEGAGDLSLIADDLGLDVDDFRHCVSTGQYRERVTAGMQKAKSLGITGTPTTYLIDNVTGRELPLPPGGGDPQSIAHLLKEYAKALSVSP